MILGCAGGVHVVRTERREKVAQRIKKDNAEAQSFRRETPPHPGVLGKEAASA
jgi:hypothetical protein